MWIYGALTQEALLVWEGDTIEVDLLFQADSYAVYPSNKTRYEDRLFTDSLFGPGGNRQIAISTGL